MKGTFNGSCHCGSVRYACDIDIAPKPERPWSPEVRYAWTYKCNCSWCKKTRYWKLFVPASAFRMLTDADALGEYRFGSNMVQHHFCKRCGVPTFGRGDLPEMGGVFYAIHLGTLENASPTDLAALPIRYEDGRNDDWDHEPAEKAHL